MTKLKITVTKEILEKSVFCSIKIIQTNCAVALAVRDIFPKAYVETDTIWPDENQVGNFLATPIHLPHAASTFIETFDNNTPEERVDMKPISFEIEIPDEIINQINIDELKPLLENHPTLQLISH